MTYPPQGPNGPQGPQWQPPAGPQWQPPASPPPSGGAPYPGGYPGGGYPGGGRPGGYPAGDPFGSAGGSGGYGAPPPYPGQGSYSGYGGYGEAPPLDARPPGRNKKPLIIGSVAIVALVAILIATAMWGLNSGDNTATGSTTSTSPTANTTTTTTSETLPTPAPGPAPTLTQSGVCEGFSGKPSAQTPAGWSTVVSPRGLVYDVPAGWEVLSCGTLIGWEKPCADGPFGYCPIRTMSGAAALNNPNGSCDGSLAAAGIPGSKDISDINAAAETESRNVADIYTSKNGVVPQVSLSPPRSLTVAGAPAVQIVANVSGIEADACEGPTAVHSIVATTVPGQPGTVLFITTLSQGIAGAPDAGVIDQMIGTLRAADKA